MCMYATVDTGTGEQGHGLKQTTNRLRTDYEQTLVMTDAFWTLVGAEPCNVVRLEQADFRSDLAASSGVY